MRTELTSARLEIDVRQCIKFVDHDVDVVASDTCAQDCDTFTLVAASDGMELATFHLTLLTFEMRGYYANATWISHEDNLVSQLFGPKMEMKDRSVVIDD